MTDYLKLDKFNLSFQRNLKTHCQICNKQFGIILREHICKRCFRSVCENCSPFKVKSYKADRKHGLHRMCTQCNIQSQILNKYIKSNHLIWGTDCDFTKLWIRQLQLDKQANQRQYRQSGIKLSPVRKIPTKKLYKQYIQVNQLWLSLNFSFREFIGIVLDQSSLKQDDIVKDINEVLSNLSICCKQKGIKLSQILYLVIFLLCHTSTRKCLQLVTFLIQTIYNFPNIQAMVAQVKQHIVYNLGQLGCTDIEIFKMQTYLDENILTFINTFLNNIFTAQLSIQVVNGLFSNKNVSQISKGIAFALEQFRQFVAENWNNSQKVQVHILRKLRAENFRKVTKSFQMTKKQSSEKSISMVSISKSRQSDIIPEEYLKILKENEELKIRNKNQQDQISRIQRQNDEIKKELNKNNNGQKSSIKSKNKRQKNYESHLIQQHSPRKKTICESQPDWQTNSGDDEILKEILSKKNQEILKLQNQLTRLRENCKLHQENYERLQDNKQVKTNNKQKQFAQLKYEYGKSMQQQISLKNIHKLLLLKMDELSTQLMDQQQKLIKQSQEKIIIAEKDKQSNHIDNDQCIIY